MWWIAGAAAVVLAAGAIWWTGFGRTQAGPPASAALGEHLADEGHEHVTVGTVIQYRDNPPASGTHYPVPAPAGVYPNGLAPGFWVHSLEHGYIVLLYKPPAPSAQLAGFDQMVKDFPQSKFGNVKLVIAPYPGMSHRYALLAWDWRLQMDTFDRATALAFYNRHVDHGREDLP